MERIEELTDALERGTTEAAWIRWHPLPRIGSITGSLDSLSTTVATTLDDVLSRWSDRGLDARFLTVGNNGSLRFDDRITTPAMLRTALRSAQSLRTQEMRYYYTIFHWWQHLAPLLSVYGRMLWQTVENSLVEHLSSVPIVSVPQARALAMSWWYAVAPDIIGVEHYGARVVVESIISGVERKIRVAGVKLWKELDVREEFVVACCVPRLYDQVRLSGVARCNNAQRKPTSWTCKLLLSKPNSQHTAIAWHSCMLKQKRTMFPMMLQSFSIAHYRFKMSSANCSRKSLWSKAN